MRGPDTVDGIAPAGTWGTWWVEQVEAKRRNAAWDMPAAQARPAEAGVPVPASPARAE
jgi:hypothetical protein